MAASKVSIIYHSNKSYLENLIEVLDDSQNKNKELIRLLKTQISKYTGGDSSVSKERAQSLMDSLLYIISFYLKQYKIEISINMVQQKSIDLLYQEAILWMKKAMNIISNQVTQIQSTLIVTDYQVYIDTLQAGFNAFLKNYNYEYNALDHIITFDYPTFNPIVNKEGIEQFDQYVQYIEIENQLCRCFKQAEIQSMLNYYQNYQDNIFNISLLLMKQILLKDIIHHDIQALVLNGEELLEVYRVLENKSKTEVYNLLVSSYYHCIYLLNLSNKSVIEYFKQGISSLTSEIYYGCLNKVLDKELSYVKAKTYKCDGFKNILFLKD